MGSSGPLLVVFGQDSSAFLSINIVTTVTHHVPNPYIHNHHPSLTPSPQLPVLDRRALVRWPK